MHERGKPQEIHGRGEALMWGKLRS
jgi:hypothetical protein